MRDASYRVTCVTTSDETRSTCPAACALDLAGDKWTLLVVRDLLRGRQYLRRARRLATRESRRTSSPTGCGAWKTAGLIEAAPYQEHPVRYAYALTAKGRGLGDVLAALARWGKRHVPGTRIPPEFRAQPEKG